MSDEPLLAVDDDFVPEEFDELELDDEKLASNDDWVFAQADRLIGSLPGRRGQSDRRTEGEVFDNRTLMTLHKFLSHGVLRSLDFPISTGKEANVFRGTNPQGEFVAVKIYRTNTATFKHVLKYIQGDERFEGVGRDKRALVNAWCQKEYRNLLRMREAGCPVPEAHHHLNNVLITEFLGTEEGPWPLLQDVGRLDDPERHFKLLWDQYKKAFIGADLVHGDFSAYNILVENVDKKPKKWMPRMIDVGQAVLSSHPMSHEFLSRDIHNLVSYFKRQKLSLDENALMRELQKEDQQ